MTIVELYKLLDPDTRIIDLAKQDDTERVDKLLENIKEQWSLLVRVKKPKNNEPDQYIASN